MHTTFLATVMVLKVVSCEDHIKSTGIFSLYHRTDAAECIEPFIYSLMQYEIVDLTCFTKVQHLHKKLEHQMDGCRSMSIIS